MPCEERAKRSRFGIRLINLNNLEYRRAVAVPGAGRSLPGGQKLPGINAALTMRIESVSGVIAFIQRDRGQIIMRILPAVQSGVASASSMRRSAGAGGFNLGESDAAKSTKAAGAAFGLQSVDALLALQGIEDPAERRRRLARRGSSALDLLDALKVEILEGRVGLETLRRLDVMLQGFSERSGEPGLDDVIDAIGVRVAVEIAKRRPVPANAA